MPLSPGITRNKSQFSTRNGNGETLEQQSMQYQAFLSSVLLPKTWLCMEEAAWEVKAAWTETVMQRSTFQSICSWENWLKFLCCFSLSGHPNTHPLLLPSFLAPHLLSQQNRFLHHPPGGWGRGKRSIENLSNVSQLYVGDAETMQISLRQPTWEKLNLFWTFLSLE